MPKDNIEEAAQLELALQNIAEDLIEQHNYTVEDITNLISDAKQNVDDANA